VIVIQGLCKSLIKKPFWLTVNFRVFAPGGPARGVRHIRAETIANVLHAKYRQEPHAVARRLERRDGRRHLLSAFWSPTAHQNRTPQYRTRTYRREAATRPNKRVGGAVNISLLQFCPGSSPGKSPAKLPLAIPKQGKSAGSYRRGKLRCGLQS
jgi:hypothetical protein